MAKNYLTDYDKAFIVGNNDTLLVRQMAAKLHKHCEVIREYLKSEGMKTLYQQQRPDIKKLLPDQEQFIKDNCKQMTVSELARATNNTSYGVNKFLKENSKTAKRIMPKRGAQVKIYDVVTQTFTRPKAQYSNTQWNEI